MEPKIVIYLKRIVKTIFIGLLWMAINTKIGISNNYAFVDGKIKISNIIFYVWFVASLVALLIYFYKLWSVDINFDEDERGDVENFTL